MNCLKIACFCTLFIQILTAICQADDLPFCSNRTIHEVTTRVGCTVGDTRCWLAKGGFCTDYVQKRVEPKRSGVEVTWTAVQPVDVKKGDIAKFAARAHYAYVEAVVRDRKGRPVSVNVSEYNFGDCLVDDQAMVTDKYKIVNTRKGIPLNAVDGGFIRSSR